MAIRTDITPQAMQTIRARFRYSPGVRAGNLLYIAGQVGRDENLQVVVDKEAQFAQAFENVKQVLTEAGATFDDVVEMVTYHTDMRDLELFISVKDRYITNLDRLPTWTGIGTTALAMPGLLVEIKCTAYLE
jgi:enamine deaminase RidA (YjgF/YER057c/UK114 family)